ncbi:MAG: hypothetical protein F7B61_05760 [Caldisphaeraceae archaeon]|nr:hypothetical protein [Caldisphaeraceae archaeon]
MKKESRVLINRCSQGICFGIILRLHSVDGVIISENGCQGLCNKLVESGYYYEIGRACGDCECNLPSLGDEHTQYTSFIYRVLQEVANIRNMKRE